jgi:UMF1 family MFS transporter
MRASSTPNDEGKSVFGWCMYDWANSAYVTTVSVGLLGPYLLNVVFPESGVRLFGVDLSAASVFPFIIGVSAAVTFLIAPVLGAIADFSGAKKRFLVFFAYMGSLATIPLYFSSSGDVLFTLVLFLVAQTAFVAANVFYDAFLPSIAAKDEMDRISGKGYAYGYIGGGFQFALSLVLILGYEQVGITQQRAVQIGMGTAGIWWAGFTLFTVRYLREHRTETSLPERYRGRGRILGYVSLGFSRTIQTTRRVGQFRHLVLFLIAFMLYNDGIQTVLSIANLYGADELELGYGALLGTLLMIQIVAGGGAVLFSRVALWVGTKNAVMISLVVWCLTVSYAYFIETATEFFILGGIIGLVLGGSQALSRSFYGSMIPADSSAEFFGFYSVFSKFSAIWGPFVFSVINQVSGSSRNAIVSLVVFFVLGLILLYLVDEEKARISRTELMGGL